MSASRLSRSLNALLACCTPFASVFLLSSWVAVDQVAPVSAQKYIIGDTFMSGAFNISEKSVQCTSPNAPCGFNLEAGCFMGKRCPPVVIFEGELSGTIEMENCDVGVMYNLFLRSHDNTISFSDGPENKNRHSQV